MNWDDLRIVIAVHQAGSYAAAAARLKVDETTVARRIARLQADLGLTLFEAVDGVRQPTASGRALLRHAIRMAGCAEQISGLAQGIDRPRSTLRIATTDSIAVEVLAPRATELLAEHSDLGLQFLASTENVNVSRWEADLAVRLRQPERGDFLVSKVADLAFYFIEPKQPEDGRQLLCAYPEDLDTTPESQYLMASGLADTARCLSKNLLVIKSLLATGRCSGILPSFMCAEFLQNDRYAATRLPISRGVWLLIQPHLKEDRQARLVIDWIKGCFATERPEGAS
ncbi:MAG: LysR family transcriptional regulator [Pseudomonadota bacterium]